jgi:hypothetical protein
MCSVRTRHEKVGVHATAQRRVPPPPAVQALLDAATAVIEGDRFPAWIERLILLAKRAPAAAHASTPPLPVRGGLLGMAGASGTAIVSLFPNFGP